MSNHHPPDAADSAPRHFTRQPLWIIPFAGVVMVVVVLVRYATVQHFVPGVGLLEAIGTAGGLGMLAASILVVRSHIRSVFWSNVALWLGMLIVAAGVSIALTLLRT